MQTPTRYGVALVKLDSDWTWSPFDLPFLLRLILLVLLVLVLVLLRLLLLLAPLCVIIFMCAVSFRCKVAWLKSRLHMEMRLPGSWTGTHKDLSRATSLLTQRNSIPTYSFLPFWPWTEILSQILIPFVKPLYIPRITNESRAGSTSLGYRPP